MVMTFSPLFNFFSIILNVHLLLTEREKERERVSGGWGEREVDTESEAGPGSELSAQSPMKGLNS